MSTYSSRDIQALIDSGHIIEAGTLLTMHGEEMPPQVREELKTRRQQLWNRASTLIAQGEEHEVQGNNREAQECYQQAARIAVDFPGLQERRKRITETLALTDAVRLRSKRIRTQTKEARGSKRSGGTGTSLFLGVVLLALAAVGWWYFQQAGNKAPSGPLAVQAPETIPSPQTEQPPTPEEILPVEEEAPIEASAQESILSPSPSINAPVAELGEQIRTATTDTVEQAEAGARELVESLTERKDPAEKQVEQQPSELKEPLPADTESIAATEEAQQSLAANETADTKQAEEQTSQPDPVEVTVSAPEPEEVETPVPAQPSSPPKEVQAVAPPVPAIPAKVLYYTAKPGDSLSKITKRILCNQDAWPELYKRNKKLIDNPDMLLPGTKLNLQGLKNRCPNR